jgi:mRNA interferase RelE/StbE
MKYQVIIDKTATSYLEKLPNNLQARIQTKIDNLADDPRPSGIKELKGSKGFYRLRVGSYRVIYTIIDNLLLVTVLRIGSRGDVYK